MSQFSQFERKLANSLDGLPLLRNFLKTGYQYLNYLASFNSKNDELHDGVLISDRLSDEINFFGYYDKSPWSRSGDYILFHQYNNETKFVDIVLRHIESKKNEIIGSSSLWNWQQGSMLQWWPNSNQIIYNKIVDFDKFGAVIVKIDGTVVKTYDYPIQSISSCGEFFVSINYSRLALLRPDYGYTLESKNFSKSLDLKNDGLWVVNSETGIGSLIITLFDLSNFHPQNEMKNAQHKVNHALVSPDGSSILFMHRWISSEGKRSRLFCIDPDGKNLKLLLDDRMISHYSWMDKEFFVAWARTHMSGDKYYKISCKTGSVEIIGENILNLYGDGHPSYSPNSEWIVTDTYPGKDRRLSLHLYNVSQNKLFCLGNFFSPWRYRGETRCDLHPRWSPDGMNIAIDSTHQGERGLYILDISHFIDE